MEVTRNPVGRTNQIDDVLELRRDLRNEQVPIEQLGTRALSLGERRPERPLEHTRLDDLGPGDDGNRAAVTVQRERGGGGSGGSAGLTRPDHSGERVCGREH